MRISVIDLLSVIDLVFVKKRLQTFVKQIAKMEDFYNQWLNRFAQTREMFQNEQNERNVHAQNKQKNE